MKDISFPIFFPEISKNNFENLQKSQYSFSFFYFFFFGGRGGSSLGEGELPQNLPCMLFPVKQVLRVYLVFWLSSIEIRLK